MSLINHVIKSSDWMVSENIKNFVESTDYNYRDSHTLLVGFLVYLYPSTTVPKNKPKQPQTIPTVKPMELDTELEIDIEQYQLIESFGIAVEWVLTGNCFIHPAHMAFMKNRLYYAGLSLDQIKHLSADLTLLRLYTMDPDIVKMIIEISHEWSTREYYEKSIKYVIKTNSEIAKLFTKKRTPPYGPTACFIIGSVLYFIWIAL
jgi:hypothetical protein